MTIPRRHTPRALLVLAVLGCHANGGRVASAAAPRTRDAHAVGIALVINNVETGYALLAPDRAADPDVRAYAERMHTDHRSLNGSLTDLLARLDIAAEDDAAGIALRDASAPRRERLRALRGGAFDAAYLDTDVGSHRELLAALDQVLAGGAGRRELREYLVQLRPALTAHLAHAEQLRVTLAMRQR